MSLLAYLCSLHALHVHASTHTIPGKGRRAGAGPSESASRRRQRPHRSGLQQHGPCLLPAPTPPTASRARLAGQPRPLGLVLAWRPQAPISWPSSPRRPQACDTWAEGGGRRATYIYIHICLYQVVKACRRARGSRGHRKAGGSGLRLPACRASLPLLCVPSCSLRHLVCVCVCVLCLCVCECVCVCV